MFCPFCGQQHGENAKFCPTSGRPMPESPKPEASDDLSLDLTIGLEPEPAAAPTPEPIRETPDPVPPTPEPLSPEPEPVPPEPEPAPPPPNHQAPPLGVGFIRRHPASPPRDFPAILSEAFALYKRHFVQLVLIAAVVLVPAALVKGCAVAVVRAPTLAAVDAASDRMEAAGHRLEGRSKRMTELTAKQAGGGLSPEEQAEFESLTAKQIQESVEVLKDAKGMAGAAVGGFLATLLGLLALAIGSALFYAIAMPLTQGATLIGVAAAASCRPVDWQLAWRAMFKVLPRLIVPVLLAAAVQFAGFLFCVVPGVIASFFLCFVPLVVLLENQSGVEALKRSFDRVLSDWGNVLAVIVVLVVIGLVTTWVSGAIFGRHLFLGSLIADLIQCAILPFPMLAMVLTYVEARRKQEPAYSSEDVGRAYDGLVG